jgi:hypothetical protein
MGGAGGKRSLQHPQLGLGATTEIMVSHIARGNGNTIQPGGGDGLAQIKDGIAGLGSQAEDNGGIALARAGGAIKDQQRFDPLDIDGHSLKAIHQLRGWRQIKI